MFLNQRRNALCADAMPVTIISRHAGMDAALLARAENMAERLLVLSGRSKFQVNIVFTGDEELQQLNQHYRSRPEPTNVLSFPFMEGAAASLAKLPIKELGDIIISVDRAEAETLLFGESLHRRLSWLMVHGLLHLLGYDHEKSAEDADIMYAKEQELLRQTDTFRRTKMAHLAINVDHVATIRQARGITEPDPVTAAAICELAGAEGIVVHLREDRRHIQDRDVRILRETVQTKLNLEMGAAREIIAIALDIVPDMVTLVPEKRAELTTEGGLDIVGQKKKLAQTVARMNKSNIPVSLFIDPDLEQVKASLDIGATFVELHTGTYADAADEKERDRQFELIRVAAEEAHLLGLRVNAGHGLNYTNTAAIAALDCIEELSIGHAIISRAVFSGLDKAVRDMRAIIERASYY